MPGCFFPFFRVLSIHVFLFFFPRSSRKVDFRQQNVVAESFHWRFGWGFVAAYVSFTSMELEDAKEIMARFFFHNKSYRSPELCVSDGPQLLPSDWGHVEKNFLRVSSTGHFTIVAWKLKDEHVRHVRKWW